LFITDVANYNKLKIKKQDRFSNSNFGEVEVEAKVEEKKKCLKCTVFTEKYGKFRGFSLTSTLTLTWQFSK
jgi:phosphatidate phosphatase PAH1